MLKQFQNIIINKTTSVKEAMKLLDKTAEKILFVVEENKKLFGSLTDGDVRRWILKDGELNSEIKDVCFKGTYFVKSNYNIEDVKKEMLKRKIVYVPVINNKREIIEFLIWDKIFDKKIIRKAKDKLEAEIVIMAGGKGTRLDPFTRILPKPLIPVGDKSILEKIIGQFTEYGNNNFYVSLNHKAKIIKSYFEEIQPEYKLNFIYEDKPLGTVGALKQLEGCIKKNILLTNCDIIIETNYSDLLNHHIENNNDITIVTSLKHYNIPYGICVVENGGRLVEIREKPEYVLQVNTGMYVLNPNLIQFIPPNEFFHITDLINKIKVTHKIGIYPISESSWIDIGEWVEYKKAVEKFYN